MNDKFDELVNGLLKHTLFEAPAAPVEEPEIEEPEVRPEIKPTPKPQKPTVPLRHPLQPTRPDVKPRPQATDKGPISPDVAAFINARK
jgi:hypothetical protein